MGLLLGNEGSGKSFLLRFFADELRHAGAAVARVGLEGLEPAEMLLSILRSLRTNPSPRESLVSLWRRLEDHLSTNGYQETDTVILFDDADLAGESVLTQIARLTRHDLTSRSRLTIVLSARPQRLGRIGARLLELSTLRIDIEPWQTSDTFEFIKSSLISAGREHPAFAEPALARLHQLTQGVPRRVSQLADLSLLAGAGRDLEEIDSEVVESVYEELGAVEV
ncbi:MAG: AAA family ATPase [Pirellulales bacterium]|nr:AAA family ATPase [Pirellulales bacterium]